MGIDIYSIWVYTYIIKGTEGKEMTTYYIYNIANDEYIGEVKATSINAAEFKAIKELNITFDSNLIAAFTERI